MPNCINCGKQTKYLYGPTADLCSECIEYLKNVVEPNANYKEGQYEKITNRNNKRTSSRKTNKKN